MIKEKKGNLIKDAENGLFEVICHGCNCNNNMGSGLAKQIKFSIPEAFAVDQATVKGDKGKLGTITHTVLHPFTVVNCYTQFDYGKDVTVYADYDAIEKSLAEVKTRFSGKKIGLPLIGAGRARGDWNRIKSIIEKIFSDPDDDVTIVEFDEDDEDLKKKLSNTTSTTSVITIPPIKNNTSQTHKLRGKRMCKECHTKHPVREMFNYLPGVWVCQIPCHEVFVKKVITFSIIQTSNNQSVNVVNNNISSPVTN